MRKISKKKQATFLKSASKFLVSIGALDGDGILEPRYASYVLETIAGLMTVEIQKEPERIYTVFCRFAESERANKLGLTGLNPYSGKYNFHVTGDCLNAKQVFDAFKIHIKKVMSSNVLFHSIRKVAL